MKKTQPIAVKATPLKNRSKESSLLETVSFYKEHLESMKDSTLKKVDLTMRNLLRKQMELLKRALSSRNYKIENRRELYAISLLLLRPK